ncbi:DUF47 domain-containing protein [Trueperella sp. LYQ143]|uniref:DUF47 domain-containing protein n=1 Tax=unclassified Trueperella TaxID=2630174 RepID=UPI0039836EB4
MGNLFGRFKGQHEVQKLLNEQANHLVRAAAALSELTSADPAARPKLNIQLHEIENDADSASHQVLQEIGTSFVLPFDRGDLINLTGQIDNCVDMIDEAGNNVVLYKIEDLPEKIFEMTDIIRSCAERAVNAVGKLQRIDQSIRSEWLEINNLENRADTLYLDMVVELFNSDADAKEIIVRKILLDSFEAAVDSFEELASWIELLTLKES